MIFLYIYGALLALTTPVMFCLLAASKQAEKHVQAGFPTFEQIPNFDVAPSFGD